MRTVWVLTRAVGSYDDYRLSLVCAFHTREAAEEARRTCEAWFEAHPRPEFNDVYIDDQGFVPELLARHTCPYDPTHAEDRPLDVPTYGVAELEVLRRCEFLDTLTTNARRVDRTHFPERAEDK